MTTTRPRPRRNRESGETVTSVLIAAGIGALALLALLTVTQMFGNKMTEVVGSGGLAETRLSILKQLQNDQAFLTQTLKHPSNQDVFRCLNEATDCRGKGGEFLVYGADGRRNELASLSNVDEISKGVSNTGTPCNQFSPSPGSGSSLCPFKYVASWSAYCPPSQNINGAASTETLCRNPLIDITVALQYNPAPGGPRSPVNFEKMKIKFLKSQVESDPRKICEMIPGSVFEPTSGGCVLPAAMVDRNCLGKCANLTQAYVTGFNEDGTPRCTCDVAVPRPCNTGGLGLVMLGMRADGAVICANGIVPFLLESGAINNLPIGQPTPTPTPAPTPAPGVPADCVIEGQTILHLGTVTGYPQAQVPWGSSCVQETRTCNDGVISGPYITLSCEVLPAPPPDPTPEPPYEPPNYIEPSTE